MSTESQRKASHLLRGRAPIPNLWTFKELRNRFHGMDPPAYAAWRACTSNRVVVPARQAGNRFLGSLKGLQVRPLLDIPLDGHAYSPLYSVKIKKLYLSCFAWYFVNKSTVILSISYISYSIFRDPDKASKSRFWPWKTLSGNCHWRVF